MIATLSCLRADRYRGPLLSRVNLGTRCPGLPCVSVIGLPVPGPKGMISSLVYAACLTGRVTEGGGLTGFKPLSGSVALQHGVSAGSKNGAGQLCLPHHTEWPGGTEWRIRSWGDPQYC